ncbi:MAG: hypothetical protein JXA25_10095 [Anaerolineales bacterium]|nr:hypothetical protein [Anaerolineales bacterium]
MMMQIPPLLIILELLILLICLGVLSRLIYRKHNQPLAAFLLTALSTGAPFMIWFFLSCVGIV